MRHHNESALLTDLYEITMLQAYFLSRMNDTAVFEFFVRKLPNVRNFLLAAGLEQVVAYLSELRFAQDDLLWLRDSGRFDSSFIQSLEDFHFTGDVDAFPEGTAFFADEPILRIAAPLREAQFVESRVLNLLHYQTLVASKAARIVIAAQGKRLIDFGLRRAHGGDAAVLSARASYLAGFDGTATTLAAPLFGIPVFGTMAHSFVQAHESEAEAFHSFARAFPHNAVLLIDTYDSEAAARQVVRLAQRLAAEEGIRIKAVRIDSGNLGAVARRVRNILDEGGCGDVNIFASGNLDEYAVQALVRSGAPIDGFGVGTRMNTSSDAPYLDCAYKLVEYAGEPRRKRSSGKMTWPGCKQVFRRHDARGTICGDTLALNSDEIQGEPLLRPVMRAGRLLEPLPPLQQNRAHTQSQIAGLPRSLQTLQAAQPYPVEVSESLWDLARRTDERQRSRAELDRMQWGIEAG
jgi:nicotinate phosphoribosyltransferase